MLCSQTSKPKLTCAGRCKASPVLLRAKVVPKAQPENGISEEVLARLRAAEEEAARLRKQLEVAQAAKGAPTADVIAGKPKRIDSTDNREVPFSASPRSSWLSEADVNFFVGDGVGETSASATKDPEADAIVQRRLLIGGGLTAAALAFALIPTEALRPKPSKPLYFYVVPLLRIQDLLGESKQIIEDADWEQLRLVLSRIQGSPNNARQNLDNCVALLEDRKVQGQAAKLASEVAEYLLAMDYNKYFDAIPVRTITPQQNAEFVAFSRQSLIAAQQRLSQFLQLVASAQPDALTAAYDAMRI